MSDKIKNIHQRLLAVMNDVEYIEKTGDVAGKYKFVPHDAVMKALHRPLVKHGIVFIPTVDKLTQDGNRTCLHVKCEFINVDDPSDRIETMHVGYGIDNQDKGVGKAMTYAVKYCLLKTFCLETGDDPENDDINHGRSEAEVDALERLLIPHKDYRNQIMQYLKNQMKVDSFKDLDTANYNKIYKRVKNYVNEQAEVTA